MPVALKSARRSSRVAPPTLSVSSWRLDALAVVGGVVALAFVPALGDTYLVSVFSQILILGGFALSLGFLLGFPRLLSLGHAAFFGGGAYAGGIVALNVGPNLVLTLGAGLVFSLVLAVTFGALVLRTTGLYFLMLTLALAQLVYVAAVQLEGLTGGTDGLVGIPYPSLGSLEVGSGTFYYVILLVVAGAYFLLRAVTRSPFGRVLVGIGSNEPRMRALGYNTRLYKLTAFVIAGAIAGVMGALWGHQNGIVAPEDVHWSFSAIALIMVFVGGIGTLIGPVLGAALVWYLEYGLSTRTELSTLITGAVFILFVFFARDGIAGLVRSAWRRVSR